MINTNKHIKKKKNIHKKSENCSVMLDCKPFGFDYIIPPDQMIEAATIFVYFSIIDNEMRIEAQTFA